MPGGAPRAVLGAPPGVCPRKPPGGAPRAVLRSRTGTSASTSSLRRIGAGAATAPGSSAQSGKAEAGKRVLQARIATPARSVTSVRSAASVRSVSSPARSFVRSVADVRPASGRLTSGGAAGAAPIEEDDGVRGGRLNADGAVLPPWSCILNSKIRYQPTTLIWKVHELPDGMDRAVKALDARRYQPTYADLGLEFALRDAPPTTGPQSGCAVPAGSTKALERICRDTKAPPREGARSPDVFKFEHPKWWGCGPKDSDALKLSSSYDNHGENWQEQGFGKEMSHSISAPVLDGRYEHQNPFMSQFAKRTDGGCIVYDVSVAMKAGCCARHPNCPKPKSRGF